MKIGEEWNFDPNVDLWLIIVEICGPSLAMLHIYEPIMLGQVWQKAQATTAHVTRNYYRKGWKCKLIHQEYWLF
jgi:hypothetical protein